MKKLILPIISACALTLTAQAQTAASSIIHKQQIRQLAGCFEVSFNYTEAYSRDTAYKMHEPYEAVALEYVVVEEEDSNNMMLQHLLVIDDTTIIKHWREDWTRGTSPLFVYEKYNHWVKSKGSDNSLEKNTWTQKVFQVSDGPRYQSTGVWRKDMQNHWYWESETDAPLPRREFTKRKDYNIIGRRNRLTFASDQIVFEQDNKKIVRADNKQDSVLCIEKGFEVFNKVADSRCQPAVEWWAKNKSYWKIVRSVWNEIYTQNNKLTITNDRAMYEKLFQINAEYVKAPSGDKEVSARIRETILQNMKTSL